MSENDGYWWLRIFLDWLPFLMFTALLIYAMRKMARRQARAMDDTKQYQAEHLAETRKLHATLERIAAAMETPRSSQ